jgi:8-oxo-dGTP pyrophosphatase MutT (NUDIX family)
VLILRFLINGIEIYDFPGGKMEAGETINETLVREVFEETGLTVCPDEEIGNYSFNRLKNGAEVVCVLFRCKIEKGQLDTSHNPSIHESGEVKGPLWVPLKDFSIERYYFGNCSQNLPELIKMAISH